MANIKSQIKRNRTNEAARNRNRSVRSALRTYVKRVHVALEAGDVDEAEMALRRAGKEIDKAASKGVLHANSASPSATLRGAATPPWTPLAVRPGTPAAP
ncbi:MAG: 30S ribosomal protein S20 [Actinobacteria bacterium]|nr:MAG: 30S ribosomal protein S20 [Actinomycetota bacterium]